MTLLPITDIMYERSMYE